MPGPNSTSFNNDFLKSAINDADPSMIIRNFKDIDGEIPAQYAEVIESSNKVFDNTKRLALVAKTNESFREIISGFNTKYQLDVQINFDSFADSLKYIVDPKNKKVVELYLSETFTRFRTIIYMKMMQSIAILSEQILDPEFLMSNTVTMGDKFTIVEKLFQFMKTIEEIYANIKIASSDLELSRINDTEELDNNGNEAVDSFLKDLQKSIESTSNDTGTPSGS